jgi:hypothetical protein
MFFSDDAWLFDDAHQWELLWKGEEVVWKVAPSLREAGYASIARSTARTNRTMMMMSFICSCRNKI